MKSISYLLSLLALISVVGCGTRTGNGLPLLTPPVQASAPGAFGGTAAAVHGFARMALGRQLVALSASPISVSDFATRFFQSGPTNLYEILEDIDGRISDINSGVTNAACLSQAPVSYTITPYGQTIEMFGQCYQQIGTNGFIQWGVSAGSTYLYVQVGAGNLAAIVTPNGADNDVRAWATVGNAGIYNSNGTTSANWDTVGSYGVMEIKAQPGSKKLEMTAAGIALGYCGAHLISDGVNIYGEGSEDTGGPCVARDPICVLASDGSTSVSSACSIDSASYALTSIGRLAATSPNPGALAHPPPGGNYDPSTYPASPNITLDGTDTDSLSFGPKTPTAGVASFP